MPFMGLVNFISVVIKDPSIVVDNLLRSARL